MNEVEITDYFRTLATNLKLIGHLEVDKKRRFASSYEEALEGMKAKMDYKHHCLVLQLTTTSYENNSADNQLKYIPLNIMIVKTCNKSDFSAQTNALRDAAIIWEKLLSKLLKDRDMGTGIKNFEKSRIQAEYIRGNVLEQCYGLGVEIKIQAKPNVKYRSDDWLDESIGIGEATIGGTFTIS